MADAEADALLDDATLIHVIFFQMAQGYSGDIKGSDRDRAIKFLNYHIENGIPIVMHNGICYDIPLFEKVLGIDLSELMIIDTMILSWYLNTDRQQHGLGTFLEDYGVEKPEVEDWENLSYEEYRHRCEEDVKINKLLWEDLKERLVDMYSRVKFCVDNGMVRGSRVSEDEVRYIDQYVGVSKVDDYIDRILTFLMGKMDTARLREKTMWEVDVAGLDKLIEELYEAWSTAKEELEKVMPEVAKYKIQAKPKKCFKKDGTLSAHGQRWEDLKATLNKRNEKGDVVAEMLEDGTIRKLSHYEPPNANGSQQVKDWLYSHGWVPENFEFKKDKEATQKWAEGGFRKCDKPEVRKVPQLSIKGDDGKELCPSVIKLADKVPEVMFYNKYTTIKNRLDTLKGWKSNLYKGKYLRARVGGLTNTFRDQHKELVNIPSDKAPYGKEIRGLLLAGEGCISLGSDLSSLEDRVKHDFMMPHDPEYVSTMMADDYDPHLLMALTANMIDEEEFKEAKLALAVKEALSPRAKAGRAAGKTTNYAAVYNSGAETLARSSGMSVPEAKALLEAYWKLNWSVKAIAEEQCVITCDKGKKWLVNPVNGFCYSLRKDSDRFSTLCQGTGSFYFDMWVDLILEKMEARFGVKRLSGSYHDEYIATFRDTETNRNVMETITRDAIKEISERYYLRRSLDCDVQFGNNYSEIH